MIKFYLETPNPGKKKGQQKTKKAMKRKATAVWKGTGKEGTGVLTTDSGVLSSTKYNYRSRFEDGKETNPEELIAAAHAGCYVMKLSFVLGEAGFTPDELEATCTVSLEGGSIKTSHLDLKAKIKGIDNDTFQECARKAKETCPISMSLNASISLNATLA
jgi:osmotically inducible protein OsmC